jgi:ABC-type transport system involved in cytochrome c biogenesis permease subunit
MKNFLSGLVFITGLILCGAFIAPGVIEKSEYNLRRFGGLPVQSNGRIKPLEAVARQSLLTLSGRQSIRLPDGKKMGPAEWLITVAAFPEVADSLRVFRIDHGEVLGLLGEQDVSKKYFSYIELEPHFESIHIQVVAIQNEEHSSFEKALIRLHDGLTLYHRLIHSFHPLGVNITRLPEEYAAWMASIAPGLNAIRSQERGESFDPESMGLFISFADRYLELSKAADLAIVPPRAIEGTWENVGQGLLDVIIGGTLSPAVMKYAQVCVAYSTADVDAFDQHLLALDAYLQPFVADQKTKLCAEQLFFWSEPFFGALILYGYAFLLTLLVWLGVGQIVERPACWILLTGFCLHTFGLALRIYIQGRPPVTNLYASAIFVGWAGVLLGLIMERVDKRGIGLAVASLVGMGTLMIAQQLSVAIDVFEQVRAVLDSNFWLGTHVIVVTLGYSAMFFAGGLAMLSVFGGVFKKNFEIQPFVRMIYASVCFALLFSFVGTMLGGIWADQSWGRFWGWDPKENGALLIVLWSAVILHANWGKMIGPRGLVLMALFGNIVTSWSWFGTNMLGVGLHSYGFMDQAFWALAGFIALQLVLIFLGAWTLRKKVLNA